MSVIDVRTDADFLISILSAAKAATGVSDIALRSPDGIEKHNMTRNEFRLIRTGEDGSRQLFVGLDRLTDDSTSRRKALNLLIWAIREFWGTKNSESSGYVYIPY